MSPLKRSSNFAARMGRWSARHRKIAIFGWLAFVIAAVAIGGAIGTKKLDPETSGAGEAGRADRILNDEFKQQAGETVLIQHPTLTTQDAKFRAAIQEVVRRVSAHKVVTNVSSPLYYDTRGQISKDGHSALVNFEIRGDSEKALDKIDPVMKTVDSIQKAHPEFTIGEFGDASAGKELDEVFAKDLEKAGLYSLPLTLFILIIAFGALVAAGLPLLLALSAVIATMGLIAIPSHLIPVGDEISAIVLLIGLAVGVDYSMFYLKREREERAAGRTKEAALEAAAATSGRSVLISGITVMIAMAGMFLTGDKTFASFGLATMLVVAVAVLGSLTVLPALLSKLGDNVDRLRVPLLSRLRRDDGEGRVWGAIVDRVLRRPVLSVVVAGGALVALALPTLNMHTVVPGLESYPKSIPVMKTYAEIQKAFPGGELPAQVVVKADDVRSAEVARGIAQLRKQALATGRLHEPVSLSVNKAGTVALVQFAIDGEGTDAASNRSLAALRDDVIPSTVGKVDGVETAVTGITAGSKDWNDLMKGAIPYVFGFVLTFAFLLMLLSFRSVVIALKAVVLNLLSVAAAYGVMVLVFQHGWGKGLLGFDYTGGIVAFMPVFLFVILFGLSMDYHVFILSRIREAVDRGANTDDAIAHGIKVTAGVVTSAAIVMVGVFAIFGTLSMIMLKQFGVGLAAAVLIDATIVRAVLLPATMKLLGEWNWYLPRWLEWLPKVSHDAEPPPAARAVPAHGE